MRIRSLKPGAVFVIAVAACLFMPTSWSQVEAPATIISEGEGAVSVVPAVVAFHFEALNQGEDYAAAVEPLVEIEDRLRAAFQAAELKPLEISVGGVRLAEIDLAKTAIISATVRFDTAPLVNAESPAEAFAERVDQVNRVVFSVAGGTLSDPMFEAADPQAAEQDAINRATENALYQADTVATLMESRIYAVQRVQIREVQWLTAETAASPAEAPNLDNLTCHARVEVEYLYAPY